MSFLNPLAFLFLASLPVIFLFHLLRIRRRESVVSSTAFWAEAQRDQRASAPFRRFRMNLLFLLQVLAVLALVLALARPYRTAQVQGHPRTVLVVDQSASMKATDVAGGRFRAARAEALRLLDGLSPGQAAMVIAAGREPRVAAPFTEDRAALRRAVEGLEPQDVTGNIPAALRLARAQLAGTAAEAAVHVFTDGAFDLAGPPDVGGAALAWHPVGRLGRNAGITAFEVRKNLYGAFDYQLFMAVTNFASEPLGFTLRIDLDGRPVRAEEVVLGGGVRRSFVVPFTHQGGGLLRAHLEVADDLAADNTAHAVIPEPRRLRVLLAGPGNAFLEKALEADPAVELGRGGIEAVGEGGYDVTVLDSQAPARLPPGRYLLVNVVPPGIPLQEVGRVPEPPVVDWDRQHPVMRHLDLSRVAIQEALRVRPVGQGRALAESPLTPLIYAFEEAGVRGIYVGFDLFRTDLPLRVAFPLFVSNALRWLAPSRLEDAGLQLAPGQAISAALPAGARQAVVRGPDGRERRVAPDGGGRLHYAETTQAGVYTVKAGDWEQRYAVNLLDAGESATAPRRLPEPPGGPPATAPRTFPVRQELWRLFGALALLLLAGEALAYHRQAAGRWSAAAAGLRAAVMLLVGAGLAGPTWARSVDRMEALFVVDASDSVSLEGRVRAQRALREAAGAMGREDSAGLIVFGGEPNLEAPLARGPLPDRLPETSTPRATDIASALRLALASLPGQGARRIVLVTDGNETRGSALDAAREARDEGVEIYSLPLRVEPAGEVLLERLVLPQEVKEGESFIARVVAWSAREAEGRLSLYRDGSFVGTQAVKLRPGKNVLAYQQSVDRPGFHVYQARLEAPGDEVAENNRSVGVVAVRGKPQVLYVEKDREQGRHLAGALRAQNLHLEQVDPGGLPTTLEGLLKYDAVILSNVSALRMSREQMELVRAYVRDHGGGLLMLGGEESFGVGGFYRTPIEEALPVTMEARQKVEIPSLAVVLVIDRSGSMDTAVGRFTRLDLAKEAAQLVVELLDERNEVGVIAFDTAWSWVVPMGPAADKDAIIREVAAIKAGGGTDMFPALKESYQALFDRQALLKHVIVLSDGESSAADFPGLVRRMARDKITVSSVAIGSDAGVQLMTELSRWGKGRFYFTEDIYSIPRIFTLETQLASKAAIIEQPFRALLTPAGHEILSDIQWGEAPPLGGYVATTPKPLSETLLVSHQRDPVLSVWRYGLGRTAAYTSDFKAKWGVLWLRWAGFPKFVGQLVRWTLRTTGRGDMLTTVALRDERGEILVEAADQKGEFVNFLDAEAGVVFPDKRQQVVPLEQVGPGRYRAAFEAAGEGAYLVGVAHRKDARVVGSELGSLVVPYSPEHRQLGTNEGLLQEVAGITGGAVIQEPGQAFTLNRRPGRAPVPAWPWLFGAAVLLFLPDVAVRRLRLAGWLGRSLEVPGAGKAPPRGPTGESIRIARGGDRRPVA